MKYIVLAMSLLLFACSEYRDADAIQRLDGSHIPAGELDDHIRHLVDTARVSGLTVTTFNRDTVVYQKAFGYANAETEDTLMTDHVFYGASLSKAVFGYLAAQLAHENIIDLDKPLQEYLDVPIPELPFEKEWRGFADLAGDERYQAITPRMCLSHTTGLPNWRWLSRTGEFTPEGKIHFFFDPGTEYSYSGEGIRLLQIFVERITGKGLEQLAQERVFKPLQMRMTSYVWQERFENQYCQGHTPTQSVIRKDTEDEASAAGSMETTPADYAIFLEHILSLCSKNSPVTRLMFTPSIRIRSKKQFGPGATIATQDNDDIILSYGLGWGILTTPHGNGYFKEGHAEGFQHYSILFPEQNMGILLMSNSENAESIYKEILATSIGDRYTPWEWEDYLPYDDTPQE